MNPAAHTRPAGSDALSAALSELSAQITADVASFVPQSVLSMF